MIAWVTSVDAILNPLFNGTSLLGYCELPLDKLAKVSGLDPRDPNNYYDPDAGYDGWELHGTFNGAPFQLYTRFGIVKIGGHVTGDALGDMLSKGAPALDLPGLVAALTAAVEAL